MKRRILSLWLLLCCTFIGHQALAQQTWTPQTLEDGASYYILNKATNLFVSQDVTLAEGSPLAFTATVTESTCKLQNKYGKFASIEIEANSGTFGSATPKSTSASFDGEETELVFTGSAEDGYKFSKTESWKYGAFNRNSASYTGYLTVNDGAFACTNDASDENNVWVLVSVSEYNASPAAKQDALARLDKAIAHADEAMKMEGMTTAGKAAIEVQKLAAQDVKRRATSWSLRPASVDDINKATEDLENKIAEFEAIADYYQACMREIEEAEAMGGAVPAACTVAKGALQIATDTKAMDAAMSTLRTTCTARLATGDGLGGFDDNVNFTGLIGNNSFDRGNMSCWYTLDIDESKVAGSLLEIIKNAVSKDAAGAAGGLAGIAEAISLGKFSENSHPVVNADYYAMKNGHNRYYYYTHDKGQMIFQPIIGLPAGAYRASALMNAKRYSVLGLTASTCQLSVITIPTSILGDVIKGIDLGAIIKGETGDVLKGILANLGQVIGKGGIKNGSAAPKNGEFVDVNCDFEIEETSIVLIVLNGGTTPLVNVIGEDWFKADNVRLTHIKSLKRAEKELGNAVANANIPEANIATKETDDRPFTYNQTIVNNYQKALDAAKKVQESGSKSATEIDAAAKKLADIEATFMEKAFQGPSAKGLYNLTMKDETLGINDKAVTFTSAGEGYNMKFTDAAGSTNFHQVVAFEKAGEAVNTYNVSITDKDGNKVYLSGTTTLSTTPNKENATVFSVVPSYTVETVAAISNGKNTLGTSSNNIILAGVSGNNAHTSLSVTPAAKHEVALNISSLGYGTFILPYSDNVPRGFTAYKATGVSADNEVVLEKADKFEACTPYIVYYKGGSKTTLSGVALATENLYTDELLTGAFILTDVPAGAGNYLLQNQESKGLGFYRVADDGLKIGANRAYLTYGGTQSVKLFIPSEDATAIETIDSEAGKNVIYDLSGRRVNNAVKGVYIINGKKVIK